MVPREVKIKVLNEAIKSLKDSDGYMCVAIRKAVSVLYNTPFLLIDKQIAYILFPQLLRVFSDYTIVDVPLTWKYVKLNGKIINLYENKEGETTRVTNYIQLKEEVLIQLRELL